MTASSGTNPISSPESSFDPTTPSTLTTVASPLSDALNRPISSSEESALISNLDGQIATISSRFTRRHQPGGYTSLHRLCKDYHHLLRSLFSHVPPAAPFTITQYLLRIIGDLNSQLPSLPIPDDPRGIFLILRELDDAVVRFAKDMGVTERVRLRNELERGRGIVGEVFEGYIGAYKVEEGIGRVYEGGLEELEEDFGMDEMIAGGRHFVDEQLEIEERLQEGGVEFED